MIKNKKNIVSNKKVLLLCLLSAFALFLTVGNSKASEKSQVKENESKTLDLLSRIDAFAETDERIRMDAAKAHYNMGNIYYQKGQYEIAAREYFHASTLMPNDPDVHYNLAFVHGEHLHDYETALKHYRMYLYLNPDAKDKAFVKKKVIDAELKVRAKVNSLLEGKHDHK